MLTRYALPIALSLLLSGPMVLAQGFDRDRNVGDGPANAQQIAPMTRVAPDGTVYVLWTDLRDGGNGQVYLAKSTNRGESFSPSRKITNAEGLQAGMQRGAQFVVDRNGTLHAVWQVRNELQKISVRYARSTDGGTTFSPPLAIAADSGMYNQDFPSVAVDSSGNPFVAWIDTREKEMGTSDNSQLYVVRSIDGGLSFNRPVRATNMPNKVGGTCECCNTSIAVSAGGNVFASFRSNINDNRDIYIARSLDGGTTYATFKAASESWKINACPMTGSSIAVDADETAHVAWRDSRPSSQGKDYIYYTTLRRSESACAPDRKICNTPAKSNYPSLGIAPDGLVFCAFQDSRNDAGDIFYVYSTDGGATFSRDAKLTHETGSSSQQLPSVAIAPNGIRYIVWQDARAGQPHIMLGRDLAGVSAVPAAEHASFELGAIQPQPVRSGGHATIDVTIPSDGTVRLTIFDVTGKEIAAGFAGTMARGSHHIDVNTSGLAQGIYFCTLRFGGSMLVRPMIIQD